MGIVLNKWCNFFFELLLLIAFIHYVTICSFMILQEQRNLYFPSHQIYFENCDLLQQVITVCVRV